MPNNLTKWTVILANTLLVAAITVFASGFFPHKAFLPGLASWEPGHGTASAGAPFDRVIFMVVDALRSDFVYGTASNFHFTQSLIRSGAAVPFTGHAGPPTITMPRVKAITTGSVPSFVDLVLNFDESDTSSTLATQDSWLAQMRAKDSGKLVMYGDDTWLRLFPGFFDRSDGTTSFFVSDFTEVDNNVTRNIPGELEQSDWSVMTLHFLGLDHIGHKTGPKGPNMPAKQAEMDGIVQLIYNALESQNHLSSTLLVLLGDHGMNEGGNHGASSAGEVSTALCFISPKFKSAFEGLPCPIDHSDDYKFYDFVQQSDIAPTLAALLGFPIPRNNLGVVIPRLLELWTRQEDQWSLLYENARQMVEIAKATFPSAFDLLNLSDSCRTNDPGDGESLACSWSKLEVLEASSGQSSSRQFSVQDLRRFLYQAQETLSGTASNYDVTRMQLGVIICIGAFLSCLPAFLHASQPIGMGEAVFIFTLAAYAITMFASSYVEEEHQFWYWAIGGWLVLLFAKTSRCHNGGILSGRTAISMIILLYGISRRWKQTGQKYAGDADLLSEIVSPNPWLLWSLILLTYADVSRSLSGKASKWMDTKQIALLPVLVAISAFVFKVAFTAADAPELLQTVELLRPLIVFTSRYPLVNLARVVFIGLAQLTACALYYETPWKSQAQLETFCCTIHDIATLFLITQSRTVNVPLFLIFGVQLRLIGKVSTVINSTDISVMSLLFQYASFFAFGGTNAISSVDLSNAYNGISGFNVIAVGALTFISNWAGSIWWSLATCRLLLVEQRQNLTTTRTTTSIVTTTTNNDSSNGNKTQNNNKGSSSSLSFDHFTRLTLFMTANTAAVMVACTVLREHLFIWTVFSPKYLYTVAWVLGHHLAVNGLCSFLV